MTSGPDWDLLLTVTELCYATLTTSVPKPTKNGVLAPTTVP